MAIFKILLLGGLSLTIADCELVSISRVQSHMAGNEVTQPCMGLHIPILVLPGGVRRIIEAPVLFQVLNILGLHIIALWGLFIKASLRKLH